MRSVHLTSLTVATVLLISSCVPTLMVTSLFHNDETPPEPPVDPPRISAVRPTKVYAGFEFHGSIWSPSFASYESPLEAGPIYTYLWDFGGAAIPNTTGQPLPLDIEFPTPGVFQASLAVSNPSGSHTFPFVLTVLELPTPKIREVRILTKLPDGGQGEPVTQLKSGSEYWFIATVVPLTSEDPMVINALPHCLPGPPQSINWVMSGGGGKTGFEPELSDLVQRIETPNMSFVAQNVGTFEGRITVTNPRGTGTRAFSYTVIP